MCSGKVWKNGFLLFYFCKFSLVYCSTKQTKENKSKDIDKIMVMYDAKNLSVLKMDK
jgi:hypothetical protein